jgi:glucose-1-phosphate thymidylyltransferase
MVLDVIVLAGGFAKRMWPLTKNKPKHLLDIAGKPMLAYTLDTLMRMENIGTIYISTNEAFEDQFRDFLSVYPETKVRLIIEPSPTEEKKLGSIGGLGYLIEKEDLSRDTMIIGGDNLFEFHPSEAIDVFDDCGKDVVAVYDVETLEKASLYGIVDIDDDNIITRFIEKPQDPPSSLAATAFYVFRAETISLVLKYLKEGGKPDALGHFIAYLVDRSSVYAWKFDGRWFDIGSIEVYREADHYFSN